LENEEIIGYYMEAAAEEEDTAGVLDALDIVGRARLINQLAVSTGIDRLRLCAALDGGPPLDDADVAKILECFSVRVSTEVPACVG
jgi:DNA-binding phage protein